MEEYVVNRNKVYLGILAHEFTTLSLSISTDPDIIEKYGDYAFVSYNDGDNRAIIFNVENSLANDLIYTTGKNYPIKKNINRQQVGHYFYIEKYVNLSKFLKELNFNESLTQNDLDMIYHKLIVSKHWLSLWLKYYELQKLCNKTKTVIPNYQLNIIKEISQIHNGLPNNHEPGFETIKRKSKIKNGN